MKNHDNDSCELFYQLSKLLAAKKRLDIQIHIIKLILFCKRLMELNLISSKKYKKIL